MLAPYGEGKASCLAGLGSVTRWPTK